MRICEPCGKSFNDTFTICLWCEKPLTILEPIGEAKLIEVEPAKTKLCPKCKESISSYATKCKHCGEKFGVLDNMEKFAIDLFVIGVSIMILVWLIPYLK